MSKIAAGLLLLAAAQPLYTDFWIVIETRDLEQIVFIDKSSITQRADGWKYFWYETVYNGSSNKVYKSDRSVGWVKCGLRTFMVQMTLAYGFDGKLVGENDTIVPEHPVVAGSIEQALLDFACGNQAGLTELPRGGETVATANKLYAQLAANSRPGAAPGPPPHPGPAAPAAPAAARAPAAAAPAKQDFWMVYAGTDASTTIFVDKASIAKTSAGKLTFPMEIVSNSIPDSEKAKLLRSTATVDCARRKFSQSEATAYAKDGSISGRTRAEPEAAISPRTPLSDVYEFVCAKNEKYAIQVDDGKTTVGFGDEIYKSYAALGQKGTKR